MCSGIRDVVNLAWKLDLTLRGLAAESLLDSYTEERRAQAKEAILASVQLGRVICVTDPADAAERDATVLANRRGRPAARPEPAKPLSDGLLHRRSAAEAAERAAGAVVPQGRVGRQGRSELFDEVVGRGFMLLTSDDPYTVLDEERLSFLVGLGTRVVRLLPPGQAPEEADGVADVICVEDVDDVYRPYLARFGATSLLVRPDYHVFGAASGPGGTEALVDDLRDQLRAAVPAGAPHRAG